MCAGEAWTVLVNEAGADEDQRAMFVDSAIRDGDRLEFRFQGKFGFGGKARLDRLTGWYVTYYPEDDTPERRALLKRVNGMLGKPAEIA